MRKTHNGRWLLNNKPTVGGISYGKELKMIYTVFINGRQKDYTDRRKAYAMARLYGAVVFTHERYITTLKEVLRG